MKYFGLLIIAIVIGVVFLAVFFYVLYKNPTHIEFLVGKNGFSIIADYKENSSD